MKTVRVAMWSGPRNISTALLRSWGARGDTFVCDEPLYAHYLRETGLDHPGRDDVLASQPNDWEAVVEWLLGPVPDGKAIFYQKHMAHHLLPNVERAWMAKLSNALLIREPKEMLTSLIKVTPSPAVEDTGLPQQWELFESLAANGVAPPVIDSKDVLDNPAGMLSALCGALDVPYDEAMLSWEAGPRDTDGVWAPHWYAAVERSTGFQPYKPKDEPVPGALQEVLAECQSIYDRLHRQRLKVS